MSNEAKDQQQPPGREASDLTHLLAGNITVVDWYRESTKEWVVEVQYEVPGLLSATMRYPNRFRAFARRDFGQQFIPDALEAYRAAC